MRRSRSRPELLRVAAVAVLSVAAWLGPATDTTAASDHARAQACAEPARHVTMYAEELPRGDGPIRLAWGHTPGSAAIPGPTIEMMEGECLAITVVNHVPEETLRELQNDPQLGSRDPTMPLGVSLHVHGVKYTTASDGTVDTDSYVRPGEARTYHWYAAPRVTAAGRVASLGTAGYWWYHDHIAGTDHGTGGIYSGLFGGLIVRRPGDLLPDRPANVIVMGPDQTINLKNWPNTPIPTAKVGERIEFLVIGIGDEFHTFHLHGHNWANTRTGFLAHQADDTQLVDARTIGPSESFGFQVIAGESVGAGAWMLHCHVQQHSDLGMVTFFRVEPADPSGPPIPSTAELRKTHRSHAEHAHPGG